jgi:hypothetical protein
VKALLSEAGSHDYLPIQGNIYSYMALRPFGDSMPPDGNPLFQDPADAIVVVGVYVTMLIQIVAPPTVFIYAFTRVVVFDPFSGALEEAATGAASFGIGLTRWRYVPGSMEDGITNLFGKMLGLLFLILFLLNGVYVLRSDRHETSKVIQLSKVFAVVGEREAAFKSPKELWLWAGAFVNVWCLIVCACAMPFLFTIGDQGAKDVVFDSLGLSFLYNLDDVAGELGFLEGKWDEDLMGDIYGKLADHPEVLFEVKEEQEDSWTPDNIYNVGNVFVVTLCFVLPFLLIFGEMHQVVAEPTGRRLDSSSGQVAALEQHVQALESQLQQLRAAVGL